MILCNDTDETLGEADPVENEEENCATREVMQVPFASPAQRLENPDTVLYNPRLSLLRLEVLPHQKLLCTEGFGRPLRV